MLVSFAIYNTQIPISQLVLKGFFNLEDTYHELLEESAFRK